MFLYGRTELAQQRYACRAVGDRMAEPFDCAEDAWLWYCRCQIARLDGVRFSAGLAEVPRPCDPDDIYRVVDRLYRARMLEAAHLMVLGVFGRRLVSPDPWDGDTETEARLWVEALDRLTTPLRAKGIVA